MHNTAKNNVLILLRIPMRYGGEQFQFGLTRLQLFMKVPFALTMDRVQGKLATNCENYYQKVFGHMGRYTLLSCAVGILESVVFGRNKNNI